MASLPPPLLPNTPLHSGQKVPFFHCLQTKRTVSIIHTVLAQEAFKEGFILLVARQAHGVAVDFLSLHVCLRLVHPLCLLIPGKAKRYKLVSKLSCVHLSKIKIKIMINNGQIVSSPPVQDDTAVAQRRLASTALTVAALRAVPTACRRSRLKKCIM